MRIQYISTAKESQRFLMVLLNKSVAIIHGSKGDSARQFAGGAKMRTTVRLVLAAAFIYLAAYSTATPYAHYGITPDVARAVGSIGFSFLIWYLIDRKLRA
jgi:hypothetical protein